jgi:hypothetical protein
MLCRKCNEPLTDSNWSTSRKAKFDYICSPCKSTEMRKFREYRKELEEFDLEISRKEENRKQYKPNPVAKSLYINAKARAKKLGREFTITIEDIIVPPLCPVFGVPMERALGSIGAGEHSPTLDRIDSSRGYSADNIEVISYKANRLKSNGNLEDFRAIVRYLESK